MKLHPRLAHIEASVSKHYDVIWDCCCDHGHLGSTLLARKAADEVIFVDILPELIDALKGKLERFFPDGHWQVMCNDVAKLPLKPTPIKQLVIIAGVGGDLMAEFVKSLNASYPAQQLEFLLCPVNRQYLVRQTLIESGLSLLDESLVEDHGRIYEVIHVSQQATGHEISATGEKIWQSLAQGSDSVAQRYLDRTLEHYGKGRSDSAKQILAAYLKIKQDSL
ncbi:tRNA (adenine(22)-N(1))-methyltransferase TrmK [Vibrio sp. SCSIO 43136]|uniref:tRNA (adenine(22)-N(1))-methyltransferase n=1 Tax=Vibrio sp. SCSIO 43136 TaxID=2819101 RepID=UPI00207550BD|nr:tRNA (adenine(22)-N(1))-methyltransferase TrmK [Vibrio sp. SCSIO 43136]USD67239.1 tRNA (adenine(22)-N(1))-methyltransferase TrmK [Vibrio sp. SCSIO 43136]